MRRSAQSIARPYVSGSIYGCALDQTYATPSLRIFKLEPDLSRRRAVAHNPEDDEHGEEPKDVYNQHRTFERGELAEKNGVWR